MHLHSTTRKIGFAAIGAYASTALAGSFACAEPADNFSTLKEVTITAKGYASETSDTPAAVTIVDREEITASGANNVGELLGGKPGIAAQRDGAWGFNPVLRGLKKESVALLVDGTRLNSAQPAGALASFVELGLLDRIEAVKGPTSVLYGIGAIGGVVNLLTPQARFSSTPGISTDLAAGVSSADSGHHLTALLRAANADHAVVLGLAKRDASDYRAPNGKVPRTGYNSDAMIGQYRVRINDSNQLRLSVQNNRENDVWYPGSAKPGTPAALGIVTIRSPLQERTLYEAGWSLKGSGETPLNLDARAYRQEVHRLVQAYSSSLGRDRARTDVTFVTDGTDLKADWLVSANNLLSFGMNWWQLAGDPARYLDTNAPLFNNNVRNDPFDQGKINATGLYAQDELGFGKLKLLGGLRYDQVKGSAKAKGNPPVTTGLNRSDNATSWSLGAVWKETPLLAPYVNISRAFRAADMRERFEDSERGDGYYYIGNPQLRPETALNVELGIKGDDDRFGYSAAIYRNTISDYITGRITGAFNAGLPVKQTENLGKVVISGFEGELRYRLGAAQQVFAGLSVLRGENKIDNEPLFQAPADSLSLGWALAPSTGLGYDATGRFVRQQNRVATRFARGLENATPGYATLDIGATWRYSKTQNLRIALKNVFDHAYHDHLTEGLSGQEIQAAGRNLQLTWKGSF